MDILHDRKIEVLFTAESIAARVAELADQLSVDLAGSQRPPIFVAIMGGAVHFYSDLTRAIGERMHIEQDFMALKSYEGQQSSGAAKILIDLRANITGRDIVVVEDIVDTCVTMREILNLLKPRNPRSIRVCALLDKVEAEKVTEVEVDYVGFELQGTPFVVGYGLDDDELYRQLPYICVIKD